MLARKGRRLADIWRGRHLRLCADRFGGHDQLLVAFKRGAHPVRMNCPNTHVSARTQHAPGNKPLCILQPRACDAGNKIAASAHVMGSGGSAVAMVIGRLGVDRRAERFFSYLAIFSPACVMGRLVHTSLSSSYLIAVRILLHLHIQRGKIVLRGSRAGRRSGCRNHPSCVCV